MVGNNNQSSPSWRFVESKEKNPLGSSQYTIRLCDDDDYVLAWSNDIQYDQSRKYMIIKKQQQAADDVNKSSLWLLVPRKKPDGSELYEIVDAETGGRNVYAAQIYERNEQLALLWDEEVNEPKGRTVQDY